MKRFLAITEEVNAAPARYRVGQFGPYFARQGRGLDIVAWPRSRNDRAALLRSLGDWDGVVLQRRLPRLGAIREIRRRACRLIFDFDDAIIYGDSAGRRPRFLMDRWIRFRALVGCCDAVTVGNRYLQALACRYAAPARVFVIPTTVRTGGEGVASRVIPGSVLGWIGARATVPYLERLRRPIEALHARRSELVVKVISDAPPRLGRVPVDWSAWDAGTEAAQLQQIRVGLAPLPEDRWTRGKCALRLLQYLDAGIPSVASPIGTQGEATAAGVALEAVTDEQWIRGVSELLDNPATACAYAAAGKRWVRERFDPLRWAPILERIWFG